MSNDVIKKVQFKDLNFEDPFFKSLSDDYPGFKEWFERKGNEKAFIFKENGLIDGFLYLKDEDESDESIDPPFSKKRRLKIGTLKINAHGTVLGQRFMGIILRKMIEERFNEVYVTLFSLQESLVKLFEKFGFTYWGKKSNGELVYVKNTEDKENIFHNFPRFKIKDSKKFLLGIYPQYHTKMFPDSILKTETSHRVEDLSVTNTIEKIYICGMDGVKQMRSGDNIVIYRTKDEYRPAEYSSVVTSMCTIIDIKNINTFQSESHFLEYCGKGSIFSENDLKRYWESKKYPFIIKMLYNVPLSKKITRNQLINDIDFSRDAYYGVLEMTENQFKKILEIGEVSEGFIID